MDLSTHRGCCHCLHCRWSSQAHIQNETAGLTSSVQLEEWIIDGEVNFRWNVHNVCSILVLAIFH